MNAVGAMDHVPVFVPGAAVSNGYFNMQFAGTTGQHYRVEATNELMATNAWQTIDDITSLPESPMDVAAPLTNAASFYRVSWFPF